MDPTSDLEVPWGATVTIPQDPSPAKAAVLGLAFAYGEAHNLAAILARPISRWRRTRQVTRGAGRALATRSPQNVVGWLTCPECGAEVPVCYQPSELGPLDDNGRTVLDLARADLWLHALVHEYEAADHA